jgi:glutathionyl-hydroquinone reductase
MTSERAAGSRQLGHDASQGDERRDGKPPGVWEGPSAFPDGGGRFVRKPSPYRNWITPDGSPGPSGDGGFAAAPGRYHLYVSYACPWAHRTLILRELKGLESLIPVSVVHWRLGASGWSFEPGPGVVPDPVLNARFLGDLYRRGDPGFNSRATTPLLWDKAQGRIVSNESADIVRMFNSAFDGVGARPGDYYPEPHRVAIDTIEERIYHQLNNGVYRAGFATTQAAYEEAAGEVFSLLDHLEEILASQRWLVGNRFTEADVRTFVTLVRFDAVYHGHFKCNVRRLVEYPNLWAYTRDIYQLGGIARTVSMQHIKHHYYESHRNINPTGIVPIGPALDFRAAHERGSLGPAPEL